MITTKAAVNGTAKNTTPASSPTSRNEHKEDVKPLHHANPLGETLKKFDELAKLTARRHSIVEALDDVSDFTISPTGSANLKFTDSNGNSFGIAHPIVIGEMVALAKSKLKDELSKIEKQIIAVFA